MTGRPSMKGSALFINVVVDRPVCNGNAELARQCHTHKPLLSSLTQSPTPSAPHQADSNRHRPVSPYSLPLHEPTMEMLHNLASLYHSLTHIHHTLGDAHDEMTTSTFHRAIQTVEHLRLTLPAQLANPRVAIVCGSGLGGLAETVDGEVREEWAYSDVPGFPVSTGMYLHSRWVD